MRIIFFYIVLYVSVCPAYYEDGWEDDRQRGRDGQHRLLLLGVQPGIFNRIAVIKGRTTENGTGTGLRERCLKWSFFILEKL